MLNRPNVIYHPPGLGDLQPLDESICSKILEIAIPSGNQYVIKAFPRGDFDRPPKLAFFCITGQLRWLAMEIWLKENEFLLAAQDLQSPTRIEPGNASDNRLEHNIQWITEMTKYTMRPNITLSCVGCAWMLLPRLFGILKLVHQYEIYITVNGARSEYHVSNGPNSPGINNPFSQGINIIFRRSDTEPKDILLEALDLAHQARVGQWPLQRLEQDFHSLLAARGCTSAKMRPSALRKCKSFLIPFTNRRVYSGPNDLLYKTTLEAARSLRVVDVGRNALTSTFKRS